MKARRMRAEQLARPRRVKAQATGGPPAGSQHRRKASAVRSFPSGNYAVEIVS